MGDTKIYSTSIEELFNIEKYKFIIPDYQRPYKWTTKHVGELLNDIVHAIKERKKNDGFRYRIGTVILCYDEKKMGKSNNEYEIVDGQQRLISLCLLKKSLDNSFIIEDHIEKNNSDYDIGFDTDSVYNIYQNYAYIDKYLNHLDSGITKDEILDSFNETIEAIIIKVSELSEAFQLFDSQNSRGKALYPHDLLKAYHLREMRNERFEMRRSVIDWESNDSDDISNLFETYLFRILKWSQGESCKSFTTDDIDFYKGASLSADYNYAKRAEKSMPYFLINEPFISGGDFFRMVRHYLNMLSDLEGYIYTNEKFDNIKRTLENEKSANTGFKHACNLFRAALLFYYDKFKNMDPMAVQKLFEWSFSIRMHRQKLGLESINLHALGKSDVYVEEVNVFKIIANARTHSDISGITMTEKENAKHYKNLIIFEDKEQENG